MDQTPENLEWAMRKLSRFDTWQGFPRSAEGVTSRARSFLRLVHNRTVREIMTDAFIRQDKDPNTIEFKLDPDLNDVDWILDLIEETMEEFPLPIQMRRSTGRSCHPPPA
jgi:hypothetical protein